MTHNSFPEDLKDLIVNAKLANKEVAEGEAHQKFDEYLRVYVGAARKNVDIQVPVQVSDDELVEQFNAWQSSTLDNTAKFAIALEETEPFSESESPTPTVEDAK